MAQVKEKTNELRVFPLALGGRVHAVCQVFGVEPDASLRVTLLIFKIPSLLVHCMERSHDGSLPVVKIRPKCLKPRVGAGSFEAIWRQRIFIYPVSVSRPQARFSDLCEPTGDVACT